MSNTPDPGRTIGRPSLLAIVLDLFTGRERWLLLGVFCLSFLAAVFETLGVASIVPFMSLVIDPSSISRYHFLADVAGAVGVTTPRGMLLLFGGITVSVVTIGDMISALNVLAQQRFVARTETRLAADLFAGYLYQPYSFHTARDAPSLMKVVVVDINQVMNAVFVPTWLAVGKGLMSVGVISLLFLRDPKVAMAVSVVLAGAYWAVYQFVHRSQERLGVVHNHSNLDRQRIAQEGLGGVKELRILGREKHATKRFEDATSVAARTRATNTTMAQLPRYALEAIAFGGILLVTLALVAEGTGSAQALIPSLALYAFAGYRLLPALQQVFGATLTVRFSYPMLIELHRDFRSVVDTMPNRLREIGAATPLPFTRELRLTGVSFAYPDGSRALSDINLVIRPNESIGLVGRTGAGKTTLADLILGLHSPTAGEIAVDDVVLTPERIRSWQRRVGYVPQHVFLSNASVSENIAFGLPLEAIDHAAVRRAAQMAQADEFINGLSDGFDTIVGERGVKLSGGQRQRIGIARALYHDPDVLVFDEATSALDGLTEDAVMEAVRSLSGHRTIVLVAHRLRTVEACDRIIVLERGQVAADGAYDELLTTSPTFRRLVGKSRSATASSSGRKEISNG